PRREAGRRQRAVDPRLLAARRGPRRLRVGQRLLARRAARPPLGAGLLGASRERLAMGARLLGGCAANRDQLCAPAARADRRRPVGAGAGRGLRLRPRLLDVARDALPVAAGLLGPTATRLALLAGPLLLD